MKKELIERTFAWIFIVSIPVTAVFWLFLSDTRGVDEDTERSFAEIVNRYHNEGDVVFPEVDWDLGFLKHLDHGITNVLLTLKESGPDDIRLFRDDGAKIFFLLKNRKSWGKLKERLSIDEYEKREAGKGVVVIVPPKEDSLHKKLIFSRDVHKASEVFFSKGEDKKPCSLVSRRWRCSKHRWNHVGYTRAVVNKRPQQVVWAHPRTGENLHIIFDIPENSSTINLNTAMLERAVRSRNRSPVKVTVIIDENKVLEYTNRSVRDVYQNKIDVPEGAERLELRFKTRDDGQRHFIFNGYIE